MPDLYFYSTPPEATVALTLDTGQTITGVPCSANGRADAHRLELPGGTVSQGGLLRVTHDGCVTFEGRGIVNVSRPCFEFDDIHLAPVPPPPQPPPKPDPTQDPFAIIQAVYEQGDYDLSTKEGCGEYTAAACLALHAQHYELWGHIRKEPPQNMWEGHAVDAVMLLAKAGTTDAGIYDIILDTESPNGQPAWSFKGPPDNNLWMPPT